MTEEGGTDSAPSFERLDDLSCQLRLYVDNYINAEKESLSPSTSSGATTVASGAGDCDINEILTNLFMLLFEFTETGQKKVVELCGKSLVKILPLCKIENGNGNGGSSDDDDDGVGVGVGDCGDNNKEEHEEADFFVDPRHSELVEQSLLIISALCNYDDSRCLLCETTPVITTCISALRTLLHNGSSITPNNHPSTISLRNKFLSCTSNLVRGHVLEFVDSGIVAPAVQLLQNSTVSSDLFGAASIILSLIESPAGKHVRTRVLLTGVVPLLLHILAQPLPSDASTTERVGHRNLQTVGLRCVACILRHQPLARRSAYQFFATEEGEQHLARVVECVGEIEDVSRWLFAAEILVWLGTEEGCRGMLGRLGAKTAMGNLVAEADPLGKWTTLLNQTASVDAFEGLWEVDKGGGGSSFFGREQRAFLALWMNRYACGGLDVSLDAFKVKQMLCSDKWMAFAMTLLASSCAVTRQHAHCALQSLRGSPIGIPLKVNLQMTGSTTTKGSKGSSRRNSSSTPSPSLSQNTTSSHNTSSVLFIYLIKPLGLEITEGKILYKTLVEAKLPLHILLRPGIQVEQISSALSSLAIGTRLAAIDGLIELRKQLEAAYDTIRATSIDRSSTAATQLIKKLQKPTESNAEDTSARLPEVFISYCWDQKAKAKILKSALEGHDVKCWMDEQQMDGGSMLFEEIDDGISASEVVISCLSPAYTRSVNCNREILLTADRKKTIVPVLLEPLEQWPPRGNMAPILAGKLYINTGDSLVTKREDSEEAQQLVHSVLELLSTTTSAKNSG